MKFGRRVALTLARPTGYFTTAPNAVVITDLRVRFSIEKHLGSEPNACTCEVFNLNAESRAELQRKPIHVRLSAGYEDSVERIFVGDLTFVETRKEGADWVSKLQMGDGERAIRHARVGRSFRAGIELKALVAEVAKAMGVDAPANLAAVTGRLASGAVVSGSAARELTRHLSARGVGWSIQDGRLQLLNDGAARPDQALVVSQETGLVGVPEFGAPKERGKPPVLSAQVLLTPALSPGGKVQMQSLNVKGTFKVVRVTHEGDTHGTEWFSSFEAVPL